MYSLTFSLVGPERTQVKPPLLAVFTNLFSRKAGRDPGKTLSESLLLAGLQVGVFFPLPAQTVAHVNEIVVVHIVHVPRTLAVRTVVPARVKSQTAREHNS